jgi:hypothetical protein
MATLETDIKNSLEILYKSPDLEGTYLIVDRFVNRAGLIEILEFKLLKIINNKKLNELGEK